MRNLNEPRRNEPVENQPESRVVSMENRRATRAEDEESLISSRQTEDLRSRWTIIQASFVDEPRKAVKEADALLSAAIKQIEESFTDQRSQLEKQWSQGSEASTEDLRLALQRYRTFFDRLLSI
jgi:hypothetical protein